MNVFLFLKSCQIIPLLLFFNTIRVKQSCAYRFVWHSTWEIQDVPAFLSLVPRPAPTETLAPNHDYGSGLVLPGSGSGLREKTESRTDFQEKTGSFQKPDPIKTAVSGSVTLLLILTLHRISKFYIIKLIKCDFFFSFHITKLNIVH